VGEKEQWEAKEGRRKRNISPTLADASATGLGSS